MQLPISSLGPILHGFEATVTYRSIIAPSHLVPLLGMTTFKYVDEPYIAKTRYSEDGIFLCSFVLPQY